MLKSPTQSEVEWFGFQTEMSGTFLLPNFTLSDESNIFTFAFLCFHMYVSLPYESAHAF